MDWLRDNFEINPYNLIMSQIWGAYHKGGFSMLKKIGVLIIFAVLSANVFAYNQNLTVTTFEELEGMNYEIREVGEDYFIVYVDGITYIVKREQ